VNIRWLRQALRDLDEAEAFIAQDNPAAATHVVLEIVRAVTFLREQPGIGRPGRVPGTRELVVPNVPFIVPYRVKGQTIEVLRVYHTSRKWPSQL